MAKEKEKKPNASQRLETVEVNIQELLNYVNRLNNDIQLIKEALSLLGNKLDAVQKAANVSDETVSALMIENKVQELKAKVDGFVAQGIMKTTETATETSFLVGKEVEADGTVVNKRIQFAVNALKPELKEKVLGAKSGDQISFSEGTLKLEVNEIYEIVLQEPAQAAPVEA